MRRTVLALLMTAGIVALPLCAQNPDDGDDPEHGVARLSLLNGDVSIQRGDSGETVAAELNAPLVALDHVLTAQGSRAEVQFDWSNMIRLGPSSEVRMGDLKDGNYLIQVAEGTTTFRVLRDTTAQVEISTPTVSVRPTQKGTYRITVRPDGSTAITVRNGRAEIFTPHGSETLNSGKTMEARGTADNPEYMINNAIPKDEWDTWNENRDRDLERSQSYRYTSQDVSGADDLDTYGRWVYDQPYGNVWVPNVSVGWAPYRVGRWSWINYYGWTWVSGDPWGWAPYHYGRWYSSPYGWAWYPGAIGPRYYWRPALVGFFGWGSGGINVGVGIGGGWGWGNVGWVPLAPYERYRPWYGRGYGNTKIINNTTIVNNTNITNIYRNARQFNGRDGVTSVQAGNFGRQRVNGDNFVRGRGNDFARAGEVQGSLPFNQSQDSRRFSDRTPAGDTVARVGAERNIRFASATQNAQVARDRSAGVTNVPTNSANNGNRGTFADRGVNTRNPGVNTGQSNLSNAGQSNSTPGGGWRRFDPSATANRSSNARSAMPSTGQNAGSNSNGGAGFSQSGRRYSSDVQRQPTGVTPRAERGSGSNPVQINPPIVRSRGRDSNSSQRNSAPSQSYAAPSYSAPPNQSLRSNDVFRGGGGNSGGNMRSAPSAPTQSAPQVQSAPSSSGRAVSGGGGGSRSAAPSGGGGGGGGSRSAPSGGSGGGGNSGGGGRRR